MDEETHSGSGGGGTGSKKPAKPKVVPLPLKREVHETHLANLRASGLSDETIKLAELYTEHNDRTLAMLVQRKAWASTNGHALVFPFYLPGAAAPHAYRVRPTRPRTEKRLGKTLREVKYDQAEAHGVLVYFTPRARAGGWYADAARSLYWTEGEKKSLALDQLGLACVGLTGVWNWGDVKHRAETNEQRLHAAIRDHVTVAGRHHVICFDADARDNDQVMMAAQRLAGVLLAAGALAVRFVCPPSLDHKGIDDFYAAFDADVTVKLLESAGEIAPLDPKSPLQSVRKLKAFRDAPISEAFLMPASYEVTRDGSLWRKAEDEKHSDVRVAPAAMFVTRELVDHYTGDYRAELSFPSDERWLTLCVSRKATADARTMIAELCPYGAPITSNSAAKIIDWLEAFVSVNALKIPRITCVASAGWHTIDGVRTFVTHEAIAATTPGAESGAQIALDTRGDRKKIFESLTPRGDLTRHTAALKRAWDADPVCAAMIAGALAATLLEPLGAANFAIHLTGESSRGKTSMLKVAASVFGDPNNAHWVASWNVTQTGAEMRAAALCDLPQCYDEIGGGGSGGDAQTAERMVYALINGGGRTRATRDLTMRETPSWRTIVLSTGERELADESTATGAQIRVVHLPMSGFGTLGAAEVDEIRGDCIAHAGRFGREWIGALLAIDDWEPYRASFQEFIQTMRRKADPADPLQARAAAYFALLAFAESLAANLGLGTHDGATMEDLFVSAGRREQVQGQSARAHDELRQWVLSDPDTFPDLGLNSSGDQDAPAASRSGKPRCGFRKDGAVLVIPAQFRLFCKRNGFSSRAVIREWIALGWALHTAGRLDKTVRLGSSTARFVYVLLPPTDSEVE